MVTCVTSDNLIGKLLVLGSVNTRAVAQNMMGADPLHSRQRYRLWSCAKSAPTSPSACGAFGDLHYPVRDSCPVNAPPSAAVGSAFAFSLKLASPLPEPFLLPRSGCAFAEPRVTDFRPIGSGFRFGWPCVAAARPSLSPFPWSSGCFHCLPGSALRLRVEAFPFRPTVASVLPIVAS